MGSKGSNTTTSSSAPPPWLSSAYQDVLGRATSAANQPYQAYTGELVAPVNAEEQAGIGGINQYANWAQPYYNAAAGYATNAAQPLTQSQIQQYQNPFTQQVGNSTEQWLANLNAQQDQQVLGNAVSQGAWGGDRAEIARANLAGQQTAAAAPTLAGIASQGYTQGVQTAEQQQQNQAQAAYSLGSLGTQAQQAGLTGAGAQIQGGQLQQGTQQALNQAQMQQFYTAQGYPFQVASYLAGIAGGLGGVAGGTSETTKPAPNPFAPYLGIAATAAGAYMGAARGGGIGPMQHFDAGGAPSVPYSGGINFIPSIQIHPGGGPPKPPDTGEEKPSSLTGGDSLGKGLGQWLSKRNGIDTSGSGFPREGSPDAEGLIIGEAHGGGVGLGDIGRGFAGDDYGGDLTANPWPQPNVNYVGSDQPIDASDIVLKGGTGGLGLGEKYEPTNAAIQADDGIGAINKALRPGQTPPSRALGFAGPAYNSPDADRQTGIGAYAPTAGHAIAASGAPPAEDRTWQQKISLPLMQAGLALMANRSPYLGEAIGTAGLAGISGYIGQEHERRLGQEKQQEIAQHGAQLSQLAQQHRDALAHEESTLAETKRYHDIEAGKPQSIVDSLGIPHTVQRSPNGSYVDMATGQPVIQPQGANAADPVADTTPDINLPPGLKPPEPQRNSNVLSSVPATTAATVKGLADYKINPASLSIRGGHREQLIGLASQYDPTYDQALYPAKQKAVSEFFAGGPMSPAGVMTAGNTAILHAADMSDAIEKMKAQPGFLNWVGSSGIPFVSYKANQLNNASVRGTPEGAALTDFETARQRFTEEVTKFYAGSAGSEAERDRAIQLLDSAKSLPELRSAISTDARLMKDKVSQLQNRLMTAMGPSAWKAALARDPNSVLLYQNSRQAFDTIDRRQQSTPRQPTQADRDYVRAHPEARDKFVTTFGVQP